MLKSRYGTVLRTEDVHSVSFFLFLPSFLFSGVVQASLIVVTRYFVDCFLELGVVGVAFGRLPVLENEDGNGC